MLYLSAVTNFNQVMAFQYASDIDNWICQNGNSVQALKNRFMQNEFHGKEEAVVKEWILDFAELTASEKARIHLRAQNSFRNKLGAFFGPTTMRANLPSRAR